MFRPLNDLERNLLMTKLIYLSVGFLKLSVSKKLFEYGTRLILEIFLRMLGKQKKSWLVFNAILMENLMRSTCNRPSLRNMI